jgi:hypothetical protein
MQSIIARGLRFREMVCASISFEAAEAWEDGLVRLDDCGDSDPTPFSHLLFGHLAMEALVTE